MLLAVLMGMVAGKADTMIHTTTGSNMNLSMKVAGRTGRGMKTAAAVIGRVEGGMWTEGIMEAEGKDMLPTTRDTIMTRGVATRARGMIGTTKAPRVAKMSPITIPRPVEMSPTAALRPAEMNLTTIPRPVGTKDPVPKIPDPGGRNTGRGTRTKAPAARLSTEETAGLGGAMMERETKTRADTRAKMSMVLVLTRARVAMKDLAPRKARAMTAGTPTRAETIKKVGTQAATRARADSRRLVRGS